MIYFVACSEANAVKIGICWGNAHSLHCRLSVLQTGCPLRLELLAADPTGNRTEEIAVHERFAHLRIHGEWFRLADELRDFISGFPPAPAKELRGGHTKNRKRRQWFEESRAA